MKLIHASMHIFSSNLGRPVQYVRLVYKSGTVIIGKSLLPHRVNPSTLALAKTGMPMA